MDIVYENIRKHNFFSKEQLTQAIKTGGLIEIEATSNE